MSDERHLIETKVSSEVVYRGHFLEVRKDQIALPDGGQAGREYIIHPGAVVIVPILDDGRLVLERQYRYPLQQVLLEFPAGKLDPGESRLTAARRELAEETGYRAREWACAGILHNAAAYSDEFIEIWFARGLEQGERQLDHGELIDLCLMQEEELDRLASAGALTDAKTLIGLLWLQKWRAGRWPLDWQTLDAAQG
ncbi:NUDIX domain-containing protein [Ideonella sp. B508-1]|uniref:NUDIX domain-containing protein n=1 Tax=Ideonella sp. B508-1 TaxID=137716 RepID=UPI00034D21E3|nr:NUDIX hydrolase [Ideonella sp. B508-1]